MSRYNRSVIYPALMLAIFVCILTFRHAPKEVNVSMDSLHYFAGASNILSGKGYSVQNFSDFAAVDPITLWPPLYSTILATTCVINRCDTLDMSGQALVLNIVFSFLSLFILYVICYDLSESKLFAVLCGLILIFCSSFQIINVYAWSESLFILVLIIFLKILYSFSQTGKLSSLLVLSFVASLAVLVRYTGLVLIVMLPVCVLVQYRDLKKISIGIVSSGAVVAMVTLPLLLRNFAHSGAFFGQGRGASKADFTADVSTFFELLTFELFGGNIFLAALFICVSTIYIFTFKCKKIRYIGYVALLIFLYAAVLLISRQLQAVELDQRMIAPMLPLVIITIAAGMSSVPRVEVKYNYIYMIPIGLLFLGVAYSGIKTDNAITYNSQYYGEIGRIDKTFYPNINSPHFRVINDALSSLDIDGDYEIITDFRRPLVIKYLDPRASSVKKLTDGCELDSTVNRHRVWLLFTEKGDLVYRSAAALVGAHRVEVESKGISFKIVLEKIESFGN